MNDKKGLFEYDNSGILITPQIIIIVFVIRFICPESQILFIGSKCVRVYVCVQLSKFRI